MVPVLFYLRWKSPFLRLLVSDVFPSCAVCRKYSQTSDNLVSYTYTHTHTSIFLSVVPNDYSTTQSSNSSLPLRPPCLHVFVLSPLSLSLSLSLPFSLPSFGGFALQNEQTKVEAEVLPGSLVHSQVTEGFALFKMIIHDDNFLLQSGL